LSAASAAPRPEFDPAALRTRSAELEALSPQEVLAWVLATYPRIAISTAFGIEGCALIDMAVKIKPDVPVFTVDTDYLFPEAVQLRERFVEKYGLSLTVLWPALTIEEQAARHGRDLYKTDPDRCCAIRKVEPTQRALRGLDAWIAGLRRDQAQARGSVNILERYDHEDGQPYVKVNPLWRWTRKDTWRYVMANDVPYNELLDRGYKSIGCWPCTRAVGENEHERAGRWAGQAKTECGIHTFAVKKS
jgi:phosphoadenosine phosphosulfate reductase